ncbi:hypothetical protein K2173_000949 [Erythroxylum novogranatense]|uniref:Uncharacterized protein n=1 Tax=Erythroxylum novogranatense TaxID=1862640 RepID=A0AAV8TSX3_9ROSI|nr:hypothetical protein K2173_000949 [Erythroxylum novogranatense]
MVSEDFSFPKINSLPTPSFLISPSLWRISSVVYPDEGGQSSNKKEALDLERKSFSYCYDEKMDMLWEHFNEESVRRRISSLEKDHESRLSVSERSGKNDKIETKTGSNCDESGKQKKCCWKSKRGYRLKHHHQQRRRQPSRPSSSQSMTKVVNVLKNIFPLSDPGQIRKW